ncbi:hypothetical protein JZU46_05255 [bacterium]|nr:hypothetical protein [bacterium]
MDNYLNQVNYLTDSMSSITDIATTTPMFYKCENCDSLFSYTIDTLLIKFKEQLIYDVKSFKKIHIFKNYINPTIINPDNGLFFCGECIGIDNKGNCYVDIAKQCPTIVGIDEL